MSPPVTVMVLGANCFSGQDFVDLLLDQGRYNVIGVGRTPERSPLFLKYKERSDQSRFRYVSCDLNRDAESLLQILEVERPEFIVNFLALSEVAPSWERPEDWYQTNCVALAKVVNHVRRGNYLRRWVQISSPEVYGTCEGRVTETAPMNPSTPYAASKAAADQLLTVYRKQFDFPLLTVRATNVYGARQQLYKIIPRSAIFISLGTMIQLHGGGQAVKSYIHIRDVSRGELAVLERGRLGETYHLSPSQGLSIRKLVERICQLMSVDFMHAVTAVAERPGQDAAYVIDSSKARSELDWQPQITLDEGLAEVIAWVRTHLSEIRSLPLQYEHRP